MKRLFVILFSLCSVAMLIQAQVVADYDVWDWNHLQHMGDNLRYFAEGRFGDAHSRFAYKESYNRQGDLTHRYVDLDFDVDVNLKAGEFIICQSNLSEYKNAEFGDLKITSGKMLYEFEENERNSCEYQYIDDQTIFLHAIKDGHFGFAASKYLTNKVSDPNVNPLPTINEEVDDSLFYDVAMWKIGNFVSFELKPLDSKYADIVDYIKSNDWTDVTAIEVQFRLTNDVECVAIDTYGQEIRMVCPSYCWEINKETQTATYTPYFVPRIYKTEWKCGEQLDLSWLGNKSLKISGWGLSESEYVTALNQNATEPLSTSVKNGTISIRGTSGNAVQLYNATGQQIYSGTSTEITVPTAGLYVLKCGSTTQKILVK